MRKYKRVKEYEFGDVIITKAPTVVGKDEKNNPAKLMMVIGITEHGFLDCLTYDGTIVKVFVGTTNSCNYDVVGKINIGQQIEEMFRIL